MLQDLTHRLLVLDQNLGEIGRGKNLKLFIDRLVLDDHTKLIRAIRQDPKSLLDHQYIKISAESTEVDEDLKLMTGAVSISTKVHFNSTLSPNPAAESTETFATNETPVAAAVKPLASSAAVSVSGPSAGTAPVSSVKAAVASVTPAVTSAVTSVAAPAPATVKSTSNTVSKVEKEEVGPVPYSELSHEIVFENGKLRVDSNIFERDQAIIIEDRYAGEYQGIITAINSSEVSIFIIITISISISIIKFLILGLGKKE